MSRRSAVYLRVSTQEQNEANQLPDLARLAAARGLQVDSTYSETVSGAARRRPELERMMGDAKRHRFDVVLVWAIDRLGRSMGDVVAHVLELERIGVDVLSAREPWLDTTGPVRSLLVSVFAWVAEQERRRLVERTNAGLARARANGVKLGRPKAHVDAAALELAMRELKTPRKAAIRLGVSRSTVYRAIASHKRVANGRR